MNTNGRLALTVLPGISIGAMSVIAIHAQDGQNAACLSQRGNRNSRPRRLSEIRREGPGNAGAVQGSFHYVVRGGKTQALDPV
jgi:hypothetical protein